jgi:glycosyltransferase involved in cell wall biosynthesis
VRILHITPHLGGGVGTVVRSYLEHSTRSSFFEHTLISLESLNEESKQLLESINCSFSENVFFELEGLIDSIANSDVVLVHWWNHPLLQHFLMKTDLPPCRLVFWSHISGTPAPNNFCRFILEYPDRFIFTTPLSYFVPEVNEISSNPKENFGCIWSTAGVERLTSFEKDWLIEDLEDISYVGNLDYTKVHKDFLAMCSALIVSGNRVNVVGPTTEEFLRDFEKLPVNQRPIVHGYVDEKIKFQLLASSKIFGYPLARHNYATCDQSLQEALFFGAVPVVLNNPMESYMVKHGVTGLVAKNSREYLTFVEGLISDRNEYIKLRSNAKSFARGAYSVTRLAGEWESEFRAMLKVAKRKRYCLQQTRGKELKPSDVFLESLGHQSALFQYHSDAVTDEALSTAEAQLRCLSSLPQWSSFTKSTPSHFAQHFCADSLLSRWSELTRSGISTQ